MQLPCAQSLRALATVLVLALMNTAAFGQATAWPARTVRIVVSYPPGGSSDVVARLLADRLSREWSRPVIVDNRPGASGTIGAGSVAQAAPDGYTFLVAAPSEIVMSRYTLRSVPYDSTKDLEPISLLARVPFVLAVHPALPVGDMRALVALAKRQPGQLNFGSWGTGTSNHLVFELLKSVARIDALHVPYKGSGPLMTDLLAGQVQVAFETITATVKQTEAGRLRAIAVASEKRTPLLSNVPTTPESGFPAVVGGSWIGLLAPPNTPSAILGKVSQDVLASLRGGLAAGLAERGLEPVGTSPQEYRAFIAAEMKKWESVIRTAGIRPQ
ncbi:MAG TPA: tripartite tricarboxylate transporter substrate binding protein [Burkholderiales bacterium]|nr:tripartite tricarboxylate transporter substrate binding protein [Burkholderiales bacterium]